MTINNIGYGPRGSLEWANNAKERIGLDPLANKYLKLGTQNQSMKYISGVSENIPFTEPHKITDKVIHKNFTGLKIQFLTIEKAVYRKKIIKIYA